MISYCTKILVKVSISPSEKIIYYIKWQVFCHVRTMILLYSRFQQKKDAGWHQLLPPSQMHLPQPVPCFTSLDFPWQDTDNLISKQVAQIRLPSQTFFEGQQQQKQTQQTEKRYIVKLIIRTFIAHSYWCSKTSTAHTTESHDLRYHLWKPYSLFE